MRSVEDPDFAKQNNRDPAASPRSPAHQAPERGLQRPSTANCRLQEGRRSAQGCAGASASSHHGTAPRYQTQGALKGLPIRITLAITWPQGVQGIENSLVEAAQVNGGVREWQEFQVQEAVTPLLSPSPIHPMTSSR